MVLGQSRALSGMGSEFLCAPPSREDVQTLGESTCQ